MVLPDPALFLVAAFGVFVIAFIFIFPILWTVMMSLKTRVDALSMPPKWIFLPTFEHYRTVWNEGSLLTYAENSLIVALISTALGLVLGVGVLVGRVIARERERRIIA